MPPEGKFQGSTYRIIRRCCACQNEVDIDGEACWMCAAKAGRRMFSKSPAHKRITMRGYVAIFVLVLGALFGLAALAKFLRGGF